MTDFDAFWIAFPRKIGKLAAMKSYDRAKKIASAAIILAGVARYADLKPEYADYCHPATWLNQGRWMDEPDSVPQRADGYGHNPPCQTHSECIERVVREGREARQKELLTNG